MPWCGQVQEVPWLPSFKLECRTCGSTAHDVIASIPPARIARTTRSTGAREDATIDNPSEKFYIDLMLQLIQAGGGYHANQLQREEWTMQGVHKRQPRGRADQKDVALIG